MTAKPFEKQGLGKCLVGTYAIRHLTKYFNCYPQELFTIGLNPGNQYEFYSYLLKYSFENALIQFEGMQKFKEKPVEEIDLILDEYPLNEKDYEEIAKSLCMYVFGMTAEEYEKKSKEKVAEKQTLEEETQKKSLTISSSGETSTKSLGETE